MITFNQTLKKILMDLIKTKLDKITDIWNGFVWEYKSIQKQINFNEEVKTNYYGDILGYFNDTLHLIESYLTIEDSKDVIFDTIGLLQIIYVQQDLTDELLYIFKLQSSLREDKNPNRDLRNELVGHPISRTSKTKKFKSSVFFGRKLSKSKIHYIKYSIESNFRGKEISYLTENIIQNHKNFLNKYFDIILTKLKGILIQYSRYIDELNFISKHKNFKVLVKLIDTRFENIYTQKEVFSRDLLLKIELKKDLHPRYKYSYDLFKKQLLKDILETQEYISSLLNKEKVKENEKIEKLPEIKIVFTNSTDKNRSKVVINKPNNLNYELQKLYSNDIVFGIDYHKEKYKNDENILNELFNMKQNFPYIDENDGEIVDNIQRKMEYFCSYEYVRILVLEKENSKYK